jgi:flagellar assembly protein FliH
VKEEPVADIRPYELGSFDEEVEARRELDRLRAEAKAAEAERDRIREQARREGLELGRKEALEAASKAERERVARETAPLAGLLEKAAAGVEARVQELAAAAERDLLGLALAVAGKIVKAEVRSNPAAAGENLRRAIELTARRQELRILAHPEDLALLEAWLPDLRRRFADLGRVDFEASESVGRGGVVVRSREGSVDASVASQLAEIERGLLG